MSTPQLSPQEIKALEYGFDDALDNDAIRQAMLDELRKDSPNVFSVFSSLLENMPVEKQEEARKKLATLLSGSMKELRLLIENNPSLNNDQKQAFLLKLQLLIDDVTLKELYTDLEEKELTEEAKTAVETNYYTFSKPITDVFNKLMQMLEETPENVVEYIKKLLSNYDEDASYNRMSGLSDLVRSIHAKRLDDGMIMKLFEYHLFHCDKQAFDEKKAKREAAERALDALKKAFEAIDLKIVEIGNTGDAISFQGLPLAEAQRKAESVSKLKEQAQGLEKAFNDFKTLHGAYIAANMEFDETVDPNPQVDELNKYETKVGEYVEKVYTLVEETSEYLEELASFETSEKALDNLDHEMAELRKQVSSVEDLSEQLRDDVESSFNTCSPNISPEMRHALLNGTDDEKITVGKQVITRLEELQHASTTDVSKVRTSISTTMNHVDLQITQVDTLMSRLLSMKYIDHDQLRDAQKQLATLKKELEQFAARLESFDKELSQKEAAFNTLKRSLSTYVAMFKRFVESRGEYRDKQEAFKARVVELTQDGSMDVTKARKKAQTEIFSDRHYIYELTQSDTDPNVFEMKRESLKVIDNWETSLEIDLYVLDHVGPILNKNWSKLSHNQKSLLVHKLYTTIVKKVEKGVDGNVTLKDVSELPEGFKTLMEKIEALKIPGYVSKKQLTKLLKDLYDRNAISSDELDALRNSIQGKRAEHCDILVNELTKLRESKLSNGEDDSPRALKRAIRTVESHMERAKKFHSPRGTISMLLKALIISEERSQIGIPDLPSELTTPETPISPIYDPVKPSMEQPPIAPVPPMPPQVPRIPNEPKPLPEEPTLTLKEKTRSERKPFSEAQKPVIPSKPEPPFVPPSLQKPKKTSEDTEDDGERILMSNIIDAINEKAKARAEERVAQWKNSLPWYKRMVQAFTLEKKRKEFFEEERDLLYKAFKEGRPEAATLRDEGEAHAHRQNIDETQAREPLSEVLKDERLNPIATDFVLGNIDEQEVRNRLAEIWDDMCNNPALAALELKKIKFVADDFVILLRAERARHELQLDIADLITNSPDAATINAAKRDLILRFRETYNQDPDLKEEIEELELTVEQIELYKNLLAAGDWLEVKKYNYYIQVSRQGATPSFSADKSDKETTLSKFSSWLGKHPWLRFGAYAGPPTVASLVIPPIAAGTVPSAIGAAIAGTFAYGHRKADNAQNATELEVMAALQDGMSPQEKLLALQVTPRPSWREPVKRMAFDRQSRLLEREVRLVNTFQPMVELTPLVEFISQTSSDFLHAPAADIQNLTPSCAALLARLDAWDKIKHNFLTSDRGASERERAMTEAHSVLRYGLKKLDLSRDELRGTDIYTNEYKTVETDYEKALTSYKSFSTKEALKTGATVGAIYFGTSMLIRYVFSGSPDKVTVTPAPGTEASTLNLDFSHDPALAAALKADGIDLSNPATALANLETWVKAHSADYTYSLEGSKIIIHGIAKDILVVDPGIKDQLLQTLGQQKFDLFIEHLKNGDTHHTTLWGMLKEVYGNAEMGNQAKNEITRYIFDATAGNPALPEIVTLAHQNGFEFTTEKLSHAVTHLDGLIREQAQWIFNNELATQHTINFINLVETHADPSVIQHAFNELPQRVQAEVLKDFIHTTGVGGDGLNAMQQLYLDRVTIQGGTAVAEVIAPKPPAPYTGTIERAMKGLGIPALLRWVRQPKNKSQNVDTI